MINRHNLIYSCLLLALWPYMTFGFIAEEILPPIEPLRAYVYLMCDVIMAVLGLCTLRARTDKIVILSFLILALLSNTINHESYTMMLNGIRDFVGLIFTLPVMRYLLTDGRGEEFRAKFNRQLLIYLCIQAFCVTEQFVRYGANDHGGGSWGNNCSGIVSTSIYFISFYLVTRNWDQSRSYFSNLWQNRLLIFLLFPTFLNETKVSFVYFALYFLFLLKMNRTYFIRMAVAAGAMVLIMPLLGWVYLKATNQEEDAIFTAEAMDVYLFGGEEEDELIEMAEKMQDDPDIEEDNLWVFDLPRFTKIFLIPDLLRPTSGGLWLGAGVGHFKGGAQVAASTFAKLNEWAFTGTRPLIFFILVQLGILGVVWYIVMLIADVNFKHCFGGPMSMNVKMMFVAISVLILFYNEAFRAMPLCAMMFYGLAITQEKVAGHHDDDEDTEPN